jgi:hypothetical protein
MDQPKDKHGHLVSIGARVRLLELSDHFLESLPPDEVEDVRSLIGEVFEVTEIDQHGRAWIGKGWSSPDEGLYRGHSLSPDANEMEVVNGNEPSSRT